MLVLNDFLDREVVEINFEHGVGKFCDKFGEQRCTTAIVEDKKNGEILAVAATFCSHKDNFSRNLGRKIALARVLEVLQLPKDVRKAVWEKYFEVRGKVN